MSFIILITVMMASGATQQVKLSEPYPTMAACEAATAAATEGYAREHPDTKVQKAECVSG